MSYFVEFKTLHGKIFVNPECIEVVAETPDGKVELSGAAGVIADVAGPVATVLRKLCTLAKNPSA